MASGSSQSDGSRSPTVLDATASSESLGSSLEGALHCSSIVFAHAVNSQQALEAAERDPRINFLETDVILGPLVTATPSPDQRMPVCSHEVGGSSDLSVKELIARAALAGKGVKLDIKDYQAIAPVLACLQLYLARAGREEDDPTARPLPLLTVRSGPATLLVPAVIVNADVLTGTVPVTSPSSSTTSRDSAQASGCRFNRSRTVVQTEEQHKAAKAFLEMIVHSCPLSIISPGWSTAGEGCGVHPPSSSPQLEGMPRYTDGMVDDMLSLVQEYAEAGAHFTFPVRASYVRDSIAALTRLLSCVPGSTLTVWSNAPLDPAQEAWIRSSLDPDRAMVDVLPAHATAHPLTHGAQSAAVRKLSFLQRVLSPLGTGLHACLPSSVAAILPPTALIDALTTGVWVTAGLLLVLKGVQQVSLRAARR